MTRWICYLLWLLLPFGAEAQEQEPRIINGSVARVDETRHLVSIRLKRHDNNFGSGHICGGALIAPNKVLTAAHCLYK